MADSDLLFQQLPGTTDLVFGEVGVITGDCEITLSATLPLLTVSAQVAVVTKVTLTATLPALSVAAYVVYESRAARPTVGKSASEWQEATPVKREIESGQQEGIRAPAYVEALHQDATKLDAPTHVDMTNTLVAVREQRAVRHDEAIRLPTATRRAAHQSMLRDRRPSRRALHQKAIGTQQPRKSVYQGMLHDRRPSRESGFQEAAKSGRLFDHASGNGLSTVLRYATRYQEAMRPPAGQWVIPPIPGPSPCYIPSPHLVFDGAWPADANLLFICEKANPIPPATVVVPTRRVYFMLNTVQVRRVAGDIDLSGRTTQVGLTIDVDSWVWSFSASMDLHAEDDIQPSSGGEPVELEVTINTHAYRLLVESISRERSFGQTSLRVSGRGKAALLAAPYSPIVTVAPTIDRTAQQLMNDVLMDNGVPLGWTVDWNLTDWLVPAGAWTHNGSYMDGVLGIANAVGAYIQPHATSQSFSVMKRYPDMPWEWGTVTPDFELPVAVVTREGIEWQNKPEYNRVFVSGTTHGYAGQVTRYGTDGALVAPSISDSLLTEEAAIRERARAVLGDTGRKAMVNLRLPVLNETGIIVPGKYVRYNDGAVSRVGLVRSTSIDAGLPEVWQTIGVETQV